MLENATVTMPYEDLKAMIDKIDNLKEVVEEYNDQQKDGMNYVTAMDKVLDLADEASKCNKAEEKQYYIAEIMKVYCETFNMKESEIMEDVPTGKAPKQETKKGGGANAAE